MSFFTSLLNVLVVVSSLFLICLVLIQRGKGGGLAGAFGGAGGSSAFGTKAGDVFTKITMITALIWIVMLMMLVILSNRGSSSFPDATTVGGKAKSSLPAKSGSELAPPPIDSLPPAPSATPSGSSKGATAPVVPPVSTSGPSAPLPVSPAPSTAAPNTAAPDTAAKPKS